MNTNAVFLYVTFDRHLPKLALALYE